MTKLYKSIKATSFVTGVLALSTALIPLASAAIYNCYYLGGGWWVCIKAQ